MKYLTIKPVTLAKFFALIFSSWVFSASAQANNATSQALFFNVMHEVGISVYKNMEAAKLEVFESCNGVYSYADIQSKLTPQANTSLEALKPQIDGIIEQAFAQTQKAFSTCEPLFSMPKQANSLSRHTTKASFEALLLKNATDMLNVTASTCKQSLTNATPANYFEAAVAITKALGSGDCAKT